MTIEESEGGIAVKADELADTAYVHGLSYVESIAAEEEKAEQEKEDETNKD